MTAPQHTVVTEAVAPQMAAFAPKRCSLTEVTLWQFRHAKSFQLQPLGQSVLLGGRNGVGKTNILEAISLFSPGRGVRQARADQFLNRDSSADTGWQVAARLDEDSGGYRLKTQWQAGQSSRVVLIEDSRITQQGLGGYCRMLSLGPRDDQLFLQGAEGLRRFFDRLIAVFDPAHIGRVQGLRQFQRQRKEIFEKGVADLAWRHAIEKQLAAKMVVVSAARGQHAQALARVCAECVPDFVVHMGAKQPSWNVRLMGGVQDLLAQSPALAVEEAIAEKLHAERYWREASDIADVWSLDWCDGDRRIPVAELSHGQQKIALLAMLLAQAWLMRRELGIAPMILLDEALSHLDQDHQELLFAHLQGLHCQFWISGVEVSRCMSLAGDALHVLLS